MYRENIKTSNYPHIQGTPPYRFFGSGNDPVGSSRRRIARDGILGRDTVCTVRYRTECPHDTAVFFSIWERCVGVVDVEPRVYTLLGQAGSTDQGTLPLGLREAGLHRSGADEREREVVYCSNRESDNLVSPDPHSTSIRRNGSPCTIRSIALAYRILNGKSPLSSLITTHDHSLVRYGLQTSCYTLPSDKTECFDTT